MSTTQSHDSLQRTYDEAAQAYLRSLPLEHFMESTSQATQRKITLESLDLVRLRRPDVHVFNELLVQYRPARRKKLGQVVPDNMIVIHAGTINAEGHFSLALEEARPFCMLEYVSNGNKRKDYDDNMQKYERDLKAPYYLLFYPDGQELSLYRLGKTKYLSVKPNERERLAIPDLELEVALLDGWVRYWYQGKLLPLPGELQLELDESRRRTRELQAECDRTQIKLDQANNDRDQERKARLALEAEIAQLRARLKE